MSGLNLSYEQTKHRWHTNIPDLVEGNPRPVDVLEPLSGTEPQGGANRPLFFLPVAEKNKTTQKQLEQSLLCFPSVPLPSCLLLLVWTGLLKPMRNLVLQTYFADVSVETLGGVADCPFLCQYYSRNTDCLQPMAPHSQTTILDERQSIHCNSSCLYNRCGSTDVYVLYSRVHFYYLQIKDCVEEDHGFFEREWPRFYCEAGVSELHLTPSMWLWQFVLHRWFDRYIKKCIFHFQFFLGSTCCKTDGKMSYSENRVPCKCGDLHPLC